MSRQESDRPRFPGAIRAACAVLLAATTLAADGPSVRYVLRHVPPGAEVAHAQWVVELEIAGLPRKGELDVELSEWGGWTDTEDYVALLDSRPELEPGSRAGRWTARLDGRRKAALSYRVRLTHLGDEEQQRRGLLPTYSEDYSFGYSWNTLVSVRVDGEPVEGAPRIRLEAPRGTQIVTGWAGRSKSKQTAELDPEMGNAPIAFGSPAFELVENRDGFPVEVRQFGRGPDATGVVAHVLSACAPAFERAFGTPARRPYRAFVTDTQGGGMGSHYGLRIGVLEGTEVEHTTSPWMLAHVTHELMHDWLGIELTERDSTLVWFKEGFTEYLALWQAAASGLVDRDWFAQRLLELEGIARERSSAGSVAFGDPSVTWRDGDGPNERLVYTGAPLLALRMDAELRAAGRSGLPQLLRDLLARDARVYGLDDLHAWCEANGLEELWDASVRGTKLPDVGESLTLAGYETALTPTDLTYLGLRTDGTGPGCTVLAVDPAGPAAGAGIHVGDVLTGWWPARAEPAVPSDPRPEYDFGLGLFVPDQEGTFLGTRRAGADRKVFVDPRVLRGAGRVSRRTSDTPALDAFFRF